MKITDEQILETFGIDARDSDMNIDLILQNARDLIAMAQEVRDHSEDALEMVGVPGMKWHEKLDAKDMNQLNKLGGLMKLQLLNEYADLSAFLADVYNRVSCASHLMDQTKLVLRGVSDG